MNYDASFINDLYPSNKLFTNTQVLSKSHSLDSLNKTVNDTKDSFGSSKKTTHYIIPPKFSPEIEKLSRDLVTSLTADLPHKGFECHVLTKRVEYWQPKDREEDHTSFNAIRFTIVVNHTTGKVWITPILTLVPEPLIIPEECPE